MDRIVLVCGSWKFEQNHWFFVVDTSHGCKILELSEGVCYDEVVRMVHEDFDLNQEIYKVKLSYISNELMHELPQDTPPIFVNNERQFRGYVQQFRKESIRLCVEISRRSHFPVEQSVRFQPKCEPKVEPFNSTCGRVNSTCGRDRQTFKQEDEDIDYDDGAEMRFDYCDDVDGASSGDEDFISVQKKCKEEDRLPPKKRNSTSNDEYLDIEMRSLQLVVGQMYPTKDDLEARLKTYSVLHRFDFDVVSSSTMLLVVRCWVPNCTWRVRASRQDPESPYFYIRIYCGEHTCSVTERSSRARQATPDILGRLYLDFVGVVGPSVLPAHVAESLNKRFGLKVHFLHGRRMVEFGRLMIDFGGVWHRYGRVW